jgi:hypothetical protein
MAIRKVWLQLSNYKEKSFFLKSNVNGLKKYQNNDLYMHQ